MLAEGEGSNDFAGRPKADLLMDLGHKTVAKLSYPGISPLLVPVIYRWAQALSSEYQSTNLGLEYFQWSQNLVSRIHNMCWSMQPLGCVTPYFWPPVVYFTWLTPEWRRHLPAWLLPERSRTVMVDGNIDEQTPLGLSQEIANSVAYLTYPEPQGEETPFLYGVAESDMSLRAEALSEAKRQRSNLNWRLPLALRSWLNSVTLVRASQQASIDPISARPKDLPSLSSSRHSGYPQSNLDIEGTLPVGFHFEKPYLASFEVDMATFPFTLFRASAPKSIEATPWLEMINQLVEKGRVQSIPKTWQPILSVAKDLTHRDCFGTLRLAMAGRSLRAKRSIGEMSEQQMLPEATLREVERPKLQLAYPVESALTQQELPIGLIVNRTIPHNPPSLGGRELEGGGNSPPPKLSLEGRGNCAKTFAGYYKFENTASTRLNPVSPQEAAMRMEDMPLTSLPPSLYPGEEGMKGGREELKESLPQLRALTLISPNLRYWFLQAEAQEIGMSPPCLSVTGPRQTSQLKESAFPPMVARIHDSGAQGTQPIVTMKQNPLAEQPPWQETSPDWDWRLRYAEPLSLSLAAQVPMGAWESRLVNVLALGERGHSDMEQAAAKFGAAYVRANLALAPLARPQGGGNPASASPDVETSALPREGRRGATETDPDAFAREVYEIIKHRLWVEKEQAQGMV